MLFCKNGKIAIVRLIKIIVFLVFMNPTVKELLEDIDAFLKKHAMSASAFGVAAVNDSKLVFSLRKQNRCPTLRTVHSIKNFMNKYVT